MDEAPIGDGRALERIVVGVAVAGEVPAQLTKSLGNDGCVFDTISEVRLVGLVFRDVVAEHALVAGQRDDALCSAEREVRVVPYEAVEDRHGVAVEGECLGAVVADHHGRDVEVAVDGKAIGEAIGRHVAVVAHVVDREHKRTLAGRDDQRCRFEPVVGLAIQIVDVDEDEVVVVKLLERAGEFEPGDHELSVAGVGVVAVEHLVVVNDQRVDEQVRDRLGPGLGKVELGRPLGCGFMAVHELGPFRVPLQQAVEFVHRPREVPLDDQLIDMA